MKHLSTLIIVSFVTLLTACQIREQSTPPVFTESPCPMEIPVGVQVRCGTVGVPENRQIKNSSQIVLSVVVANSSNVTSDLPPVILLNGGPGAETLNSLSFALNLFRGILSERPVIFFDQRGVGLSSPALECPEINSAQNEALTQNLPGHEEDQLIADALAACKAHLENSDINMAAYTTSASADDVRDIIAALKYPKVYLLGISYGTRLAQVTIQRHQAEGWIAGAILDSVVPLQVNEQQEFWPNAQSIFNLIFEKCNSDTKCSASYPDLQKVFYTSMEQLRQTPLEVKIFHPQTGKSMVVIVDEKDYFSLLFNLIYDPYETTKIPQIIASVSQGDSDVLREPIQNALTYSQNIAWGMGMSVHCTDEGMTLDLNAIKETIATLDPIYQQLAEGDAENLLAQCRDWGAGTAASVENRPLKTELPLLILSGELDPITPVVWGELLHQSISSSYFFEFPGASHGVYGTFGMVNSCAESLVLDFLHNSSQSPDDTCVSKLKPLPFRPPSN